MTLRLSFALAVLFAAIVCPASSLIAKTPEPEKAEAETLWVYPPVVQIYKAGENLKIVVEPNLLMDREKIPTIESIRLESPKGRFLGLKTFNPKDEKRRAEFFLLPKEVKVKKVKVRVISSAYGEWISLVPLKETFKPELTVYSVPEDIEAAKKVEAEAEKLEASQTEDASPAS